MMTCFFINFGVISPPARDLFAGFLPTGVQSYATLQSVAIIGAVIMPHNIYLHSALVTEKGVNKDDKRQVREANYYFALDSAIALSVSFIVNLALLSSFAAGFFSEVCTDHVTSDGGRMNLGCLISLEEPDTEVCADVVACACFNSGGMPGYCAKIGLEEAGAAMQSLLGSYAKYIFALGLFAAGQASTLTGTFAGQYVMNGFMQFKIPIWMRTLITRLIALGPALVIAILQAYIPSFSEANEWLNVLQAVQLPFAILPLLHFVQKEEIMGAEFRLRAVWKRVILWTIAVAIICTNFFLVVSHITPLEPAWYVWFLGSLVSVAYLWLCYMCISDDVKTFGRLMGCFSNKKPPTDVLETASPLTRTSETTEQKEASREPNEKTDSQPS